MRRTLLLALPLMAAQVLQMGNSFADALVAGRLGRVELAAGGIATSLFFFASLACIGLTAGLSPTLSRMIGQGRRAYVGEVFRQGLYLGGATGALAMLGLWVVYKSVPDWSFEPELIPLIQDYLQVALWALLPLGLFMACRNVLEATAWTGPVLMVQLIGLIVNVLGNLAFGLGYFGAPKLGLLGIGLSTLVVHLCILLVVVLILCHKKLHRYHLFERWSAVDFTVIGGMLKLSVPIYVGMVFEAGLFLATAIQMGMLGGLEAAAHYIAINMAAFCYMLPLGLSFVLTARIGRAMGRQNPPVSIFLRLVSGSFVALIMVLCTMALLIFLRFPLTDLYGADEQVQALAANLLLLAALFQLSDSAQICLIGMLRGLHDTFIPMVINAFSYWAVAFALGYYLAHHMGWRAYGFWTGLIVGLSLASLLLGMRLRRVYREYQIEQTGGFKVKSHA